MVGIDIAEEMVHLANSYAKTLSGYNVRFELMDGEHTTFADSKFDAVLCSYGIFFLPDIANGITEWKRDEAWWLGMFFGLWRTRHSSRSPIYLKSASANSAVIPDKKRPFGWQRLVDPQALVTLLDHAGMTNVEVREVNMATSCRTKKHGGISAGTVVSEGLWRSSIQQICSSSRKSTYARSRR